jgi:hypothetical protein
MQKMVSLFVREGQPYRAIDQYMPDAQWVADGHGVATQKHDGTACAVFNGVLHCRRHRKFIPVTPEDKNCKWHNEWLEENDISTYENGTYELCGPNIQANPEGLDRITLIKHGSVQFDDAPRTFNELRDWLAAKDIEGLVWHWYHPYREMIKIKKIDFGLGRKPQ